MGNIEKKDDLLELLKKSNIKKFKNDLIIEKIIKEIEKRVRNITHHKYKETVIFRDNMEFRLLGVKVDYWKPKDTFNIENFVSIKLFYTCYSKLPKIKRELLNDIENDFIMNNELPGYHNYKKQIWEIMRFDVDLNQALTGKFLLDIR